MESRKQSQYNTKRKKITTKWKCCTWAVVQRRTIPHDTNPV